MFLGGSDNFPTVVYLCLGKLKPVQHLWSLVLVSSNKCPTVSVLNLGKFKKLPHGFGLGSNTCGHRISVNWPTLESWEAQTSSQHLWSLVFEVQTTAQLFQS